MRRFVRTLHRVGRAAVGRWSAAVVGAAVLCAVVFVLPVYDDARAQAGNAPQNPTAILNSAAAVVTVSWGAAPNPGASPMYEVQRAVNGASFATLAVVDDALVYADMPVTVGATLQYRIRLVLAGEDSLLSGATDRVIVDCPRDAADQGVLSDGTCGMCPAGEHRAPLGECVADNVVELLDWCLANYGTGAILMESFSNEVYELNNGPVCDVADPDGQELCRAADFGDQYIGGGRYRCLPRGAFRSSGESDFELSACAVRAGGSAAYVFDLDGNYCECASGYEAGESGACRCPAGEGISFDADDSSILINGVCGQCPFDREARDGVCMKCQSGQHPDIFGECNGENEVQLLDWCVLNYGAENARGGENTFCILPDAPAVQKCGTDGFFAQQEDTDNDGNDEDVCKVSFFDVAYSGNACEARNEGRATYEFGPTGNLCVCSLDYESEQCAANAGRDVGAALLDDNRVTLRWLPAPGDDGFAGYHVHRAVNGTVFVTVGLTGAGELFYVDADVTAGTTLSYRVRWDGAPGPAGEVWPLSGASNSVVVVARDCNGVLNRAEAAAGSAAAQRGACGAACAADEAGVGAACVANAPGTPLATVLLAERAVSVWWGAAPRPGDSPSYEVQRATTALGAAGDFAAVATVTTGLFYLDADLFAPATLRYRIRLGHADAGLTLLSAPSAAATLARQECAALLRADFSGLCGACLDYATAVGEGCALNAATGLTATLLSDHAVSLRWEAAPGAGEEFRYEVLRATVGAVGGATVSVAAVASLFFHDEGVTVGTTVRYYVRLESSDAGTTLSLSAGSNAVTILQDDCEGMLRMEGPRGSCGECNETVAHALPVISSLTLPDVCIKKALPDDDDLEDGFGDVDEAVLCRAFGGVVQGTAADGQVCSEVDAADTFCIVNAGAATGYAFACRGLFKHARRCNFDFKRPALNPFLCGPRCGGDNGRALGRHTEGCAEAAGP